MNDLAEEPNDIDQNCFERGSHLRKESIRKYRNGNGRRKKNLRDENEISKL